MDSMYRNGQNWTEVDWIRPKRSKYYTVVAEKVCTMLQLLDIIYIARHVKSLLFMLLYDLVDYFDFETKIEGFPIYSTFFGSIITYLASSKTPLIKALQSKTSSKIKSVKKKVY